MLLKSNLNSQCEVQQLYKNLIVPEAQYGECIFPLLIFITTFSQLFITSHCLPLFHECMYYKVLYTWEMK